MPFDTKVAKREAEMDGGEWRLRTVIFDALLRIADLDRQLATVRAETVEECAKVAEGDTKHHWYAYCREIAAAIRRLSDADDEVK